MFRLSLKTYNAGNHRVNITWFQITLELTQCSSHIPDAMTEKVFFQNIHIYSRSGVLLKTHYK